MDKRFREVSGKFGEFLYKLYPHESLRQGQLLGLRLKGDEIWQVALVEGPDWRPPKGTLEMVLISERRLGREPGGAFRVVPLLNRLLWKNLGTPQSLMDDPLKVRGGQLVVATWEFPDPHWYVGEVGRSEGELGFGIDDDLYGPIIMNGSPAASVVIVADAWGPKDWRPEKRKRRS